MRLRPMTRRVTLGGGTTSPFCSKQALSAAAMVAPLSTSVPSQSKIASLFAMRKQLLDRRHDIVSARAALSLDRRSQILALLVLIEFAGAADLDRLDLEADDRLGHGFELAGFHLGPSP